MKFGIIADIHSNQAAFKRVLKQLKQVDQILCLGDIIGFGSEPNQCVDLIRANNVISVQGNNDANPKRKNFQELSEENKKYVKSLPLIHELEVHRRQKIQMVHGSLFSPLDEYIVNIAEAKRNFSAMSGRLCLVGHSHLPIIFYQINQDIADTYPVEGSCHISLDQFSKSIVNVGSVGQPKGKDARPSYGIFDDKKFEIEILKIG